MKLSSSQLEAFYSVARTRNFTAAAKSLHISQSALSQRILNLEAALETTLFIRDRAGLELTPVAQELLKYCQMQEGFEAEFLGHLKSKKTNELAGVIRIAGFSSVTRSLVMPALAPLLKKNPELRLNCKTAEVHELIGLLKTAEADFILLDEKIEREEFATEIIGKERNVLVEAKDYSGPDVYLDHDENDQTTVRYLKKAGKSSGKIQRHFLDDVYGVLEGVKLGMGRAVISEHLLCDKKDFRILQSSIALESPIVLIYYKQPYYTRLQTAVIETLKKNVPKYLA